jgi:hypothetical protein
MTPRYEQNLERYEALVETNSAVERKGATMLKPKPTAKKKSR